MHYISVRLLMSLQATTLFGFKCATINTAVVPNYANIVQG